MRRARVHPHPLTLTESPARRKGWSPRTGLPRSVEALTMASVACVLYLVGQNAVHVGCLLMALLSILLGIRAFLISGRHRITPTGVYMLSFAVFAGGGTVLGAAMPEWGTSPTLLTVQFVLLLSHIAIWYVLRSPVTGEPKTELSAPDLKQEPPLGVLLVTGCGLFVVGAASFGYRPLGPFPEAALFIGTTLASLWALSRSRYPGPIAGLVTATLAAGYYWISFDGYGRLRVAALFVTMLCLMTWRVGRPWIKKVMVLIIPGALAVMSQDRGAGSLISPIYRFASLVDLAEAGRLDYGYGSTFLDAAVALVPRAFWPDKPEGFGRILASIFSPQYLDAGHSDVALFAGEWYYNWRWLGVVLMVPAVGLVLRWLDSFVATSETRAITRASDLRNITLAAVVAAGMMDLFWVGTSTFMGRTGTRSVVLIGAFIVIGALQSSDLRRAGGGLR